jgi:transposase
MKGVIFMPGFKPIDQQIKAEILTKIRNEGMRVTEAAELYSVSSKTIYAWLRANVVNSNTSILQLNRLKKENEQLVFFVFA